MKSYFGSKHQLAGLVTVLTAILTGAPPSAARPIISRATDLQGGAAIASLQRQGLYDTLAEAVSAASQGAVSQQGYLKASNTEAADNFGRSVAISGDTIVVGAPREDSSATGVNGNQANNAALVSGAAYVFVRSGAGLWSQQAYLKASNTEAGDDFGRSVAISGDTIVVGAPEEDSNATGVNGNQADNSAVVGRRRLRVRAHRHDVDPAGLPQGLQHRSAATGSATSVAVSGDTIVVGALAEDSNATGVNGNQADNSAVRCGRGLRLRAQRRDVDPAGLPQGLEHRVPSDSFGISVAVSGDTVVVGARFEDSNATGVNGRPGRQQRHRRAAPPTCSPAAPRRLEPAGLPEGLQHRGRRRVRRLGGDLRRHDRRRSGARGQQRHRRGREPGRQHRARGRRRLRLHAQRHGAGPSRPTSRPPTPTRATTSARSVAISGDTIVVGAFGEDSNATGVNGNQADNSTRFAGAAYVFVRSAGVWTQQAYLKSSNTAWTGLLGDQFGGSVAASGGTVVIGATEEDSAAVGVGGDDADNSATEAGAAYVFAALGPTNTPPAAAAGGPYDVAEGGAVALDGSASSDPDEPAAGLTYEWDLDGDGVFGEAGETGATPTFPAAGLDGPSTRVVSLRVTDAGALSDTDTATLDVTNVAPSVGTPLVSPEPSEEGSLVTASATFGDPGTPDTFTCTVDYGDGSGPVAGTVAGAACTGPPRVSPDDGVYAVEIAVSDDDGGAGTASAAHGTDNVAPAIVATTNSAGSCCDTPTGSVVEVSADFTDPGVDNPGAGTFEDFTGATIDWGDGTVESASVSATPGAAGLPTTGTVSGSHVYAGGGVFTVTLTVADDDGGTDAATLTAFVSGVGLKDGELQVVGTAFEDSIDVQGKKGMIVVQANFLGGSGKIAFPAGTVTTLRVVAGDGDNQVKVQKDVTVPALLVGGSGRDQLQAGGGPAVLDGGAGDDELKGGDAGDVLLGGAGNDQLRGGDADDVLLGGEDDDVLFGRGGDDLLDGGPGDDELRGNQGDDGLDGGPGADLCKGKPGTDVVVGCEL